MVSSLTAVLLQTAYGLISDNCETGSLLVENVCFRKDCEVKVKFQAEQSIIVNTFGSAGNKASVLREYSFRVENSKDGAICIYRICRAVHLLAING